VGGERAEVVGRLDEKGGARCHLILNASAHHRALHDGRLVITGTAPHDLQFTHGDGRPYGAPPPPSSRFATEEDDLIADAESALRNLGFSAVHARQAVKLARAHVSAEATTQDLVREALRARRA